MEGTLLRKLGLAALVFALLVATLMGLVVYGTWKESKAAQNKMDQSRLLNQIAAGVLDGLRDAEAGQRGFLLTGQQSYLEPYYAGTAKASISLAALTRAMEKGDKEQPDVTRLRSLVSSKLAEMQSTVDARKSSDVAHALEIVNSGQGKAAMDALRKLTAKIEQDEYNLQTASLAVVRNAEERVLITTIFGSAILLFLLSGAIIAINRHSVGRDRLIVELASSKDEVTQVRDLLQTTLSSVGDAIITTDNEGLITFMNHVAQKLTGWSLEMSYKVHLDKVFKIVNQETRAEVESPVSKVLRLGTIVGLANHTILLNRDGIETHIDDSGAPIRDRQGNVMGVVLVFRDINERRQAEIELERAARKNEDILASIADGFLSVDTAFRILYVNEKAAELLDCESAAALAGKVLWNECQELPATVLGKSLLRSMKDRVVVEVQEERIGKRIILTRAYPSELGLSCYLVDVTEKQDLLRGLRESQERLSRSLRAAKAAGWEMDLETGDTVWSEEARDLFRGSNTGFDFRKPDSFGSVHEDDQAAVAAYCETLSSSRDGAHDVEFRIVHEGGISWIRLIGEAVHRGDGKVTGWGGLALDITDRKRLEEKLRDAAKLESLGVLAGGIAHDFNNLLTGIIGNASLAAEHSSATGQLQELIGGVLAAGSRAAELTRQMLAYSGRGGFFVQSLNLSKEVVEIVDLLRATAGTRAELRLLLDERVPHVDADPAQIQQLVMNLVINAAEAINTRHGVVTVSTKIQQIDQQYIRDRLFSYSITPGTYAVLEVDDNGHGIDAATQAKIFDPFFTTKFTGRGLGLAAVLGIVRGLKGAIEVISNPGLGTTFKIFLPFGKLPVKDHSAEMPPAVSAATGYGTILLVDDELVVQHTIARTLKMRGFDVLPAFNGEEAIRILAENREAVRLIILDLTMPVMSGDQALPELRRLKPDALILAASGFSENDALQRFGATVDGFLQKPFTSARLIQKVISLLERQKQG